MGGARSVTQMCNHEILFYCSFAEKVIQENMRSIQETVPAAAGVNDGRFVVQNVYAYINYRFLVFFPIFE